MKDRDLFGFSLPDGAATPARQLGLPLRPAFSVALEGSSTPFRFQLWSGEESNHMARNTEAFRQETAAIGARWAAALTRRYGRNAKKIAGAFGCEVRTAESWLAGQAPFARVLISAWRLHGAAMVAEVLAPGSDWQRAATVDDTLSQVEAKLAELGDELAQLRGER